MHSKDMSKSVINLQLKRGRKKKKKEKGNVKKRHIGAGKGGSGRGKLFIWSSICFHDFIKIHFLPTYTSEIWIS